MLNTMTNTMLNTGSNTSGVTTFKSQPIITSTILANTDSSTNIATTAWSNAFWTYVKTQANTFSGTTTFSNTTNINTTGSATTTIGNILSTTNISGSSINISGALNINTGGTATTTIGNILSTTNISGNTINIGNTGLSATGVVNIASGTNTTGSVAYLGSTTLPTLYVRGKNVLINYQTTGTYTYIGSATSGETNIVGTTNITGNANIGTQGVSSLYLRGEYVVLNDTGGSVNIGGVSAGTVNLYRPLTINYAPSAITNNNQIGYVTNYTWGNSARGANDAFYMADFINQPVGIYLLTLGPAIFYDLDTSKRCDVIFPIQTNVIMLSSSSGMENGGSVSTKYSICITLPLKFTSVTNRFAAAFITYSGGFSCLGAGSSLLRIA